MEIIVGNIDGELDDDSLVQGVVVDVVDDLHLLGFLSEVDTDDGGAVLEAELVVQILADGLADRFVDLSVDPAGLGLGDGDFARELGLELGFDLVLPAFLVLAYG